MSRRTRSQWFSVVSTSKRDRSNRRHSPRLEARRLRVERLEERTTLLAVFSVTNIDVTGPGSLRQAVDDANTTVGADEIVFSSLFDTPQTINLDSASHLGPLTLTDSATTTITGPGAHLLSIDGNRRSRVFEVAAGASAAISGLTITGGEAEEGGGLAQQRLGGAHPRRGEWEPRRPWRRWGRWRRAGQQLLQHDVARRLHDQQQRLGVA
jgi:hypothetical protein